VPHILPFCLCGGPHGKAGCRIFCPSAFCLRTAVEDHAGRPGAAYFALLPFACLTPESRDGPHAGRPGALPSCLLLACRWAGTVDTGRERGDSAVRRHPQPTNQRIVGDQVSARWALNQPSSTS